MKNATTIKKAQITVFLDHNQKVINNHKKIVNRLTPEVRHHENGNHEESDQQMKQAIMAIYERILEDKFFSHRVI